MYMILAGVRFYEFFLWASGKSATYVMRPASIEAFLPISALVALKHLVITGQFDRIHPAGLVIFLSAILSAWVARRGMCGWICPVGFLSRLLEQAGYVFKASFCLPRYATFLLLPIKYLILSFFLFMVCIRMDIRSIEAFMDSPYNMTADVRMLMFFLQPSTMTIVVIGGMIMLSLVFRNFWCKYICPYGAFLGLISVPGLLRISRDDRACTGCRRCSAACPVCIEVHGSDVVAGSECIGCLECVNACNTPGALKVESLWGQTVPSVVIPLILLFIFLGGWITAELTGHWHSSVTSQAIRMLFANH